MVPHGRPPPPWEWIGVDGEMLGGMGGQEGEGPGIAM